MRRLPPSIPVTYSLVVGIDNTSVALTIDTSLCVPFADDSESDFLRQDLISRAVDLSLSPVHAGKRTPTSYIIRSLANGSRTIVHHRDMPELSRGDIARIPTARYDWVHFEGRNGSETLAALREIQETITAQEHQPVISLELEKPRECLLDMVPLADVVCPISPLP